MGTNLFFAARAASAIVTRAVAAIAAALPAGLAHGQIVSGTADIGATSTIGEPGSGTAAGGGESVTFSTEYSNSFSGDQNPFPEDTARANSSLSCTLTPISIEALGSVSTDVDLFSGFSEAGNANAHSSLTVVFTVDQPTPWHVVRGQIYGTHAGGSCSLTSGPLVIFSEFAGSDELEGKSGTLNPGTYTFAVEISASSDWSFFSGLFAGADFDVHFSLTPPPPACSSDFTDDGLVDDSDFVIFAAAYQAFSIPPADPVADLTEDGFVDDSDFVIFAAQYEEFTCP